TLAQASGQLNRTAEQLTVGRERFERALPLEADIEEQVRQRERTGPQEAPHGAQEGARLHGSEVPRRVHEPTSIIVEILFALGRVREHLDRAPGRAQRKHVALNERLAYCGKCVQVVRDTASTSDRIRRLIGKYADRPAGE